MDRNRLLKTIYAPFFEGLNPSSSLYRQRASSAIAFRSHFKKFLSNDIKPINIICKPFSNSCFTQLSKASCSLEGLTDKVSIDKHVNTLEYIHDITSKRDIFFVTTKELLTAHKILLDGEFRSIPVQIKGYPLAIFPYPSEIPYLITLFNRWVYSYDKAIHPYIYGCELFLNFTHIHPFRDGNGRLGRTLFTCFLLHHKFTPPNFVCDRRTYLEAVYRGQQLGDREYFYRYMLGK